MIYLDASAIVAILASEDDGDSLLERLAQDEGPFFTSPVTRFEAVLSLARARAPSPQDQQTRSARQSALQIASDAVRYLLDDLDVMEMNISPAIGLLAVQTSTLYGRSVGHPAALNFGDCFTYACAKTLGAALLYKGNDFAKTDLR